MEKQQKKRFRYDQPIYDARELGTGKTIILGLQHMFAMFGATVLVPAISGLSVAATLLFAGIATLFFHLVTKRKVPVFLGSSFAFLGAYGLVAANGQSIPLTYSCVGVACAGILYVVLAGLIKAYGAKKVLRFFPPVVTGPIIISIGLTLSGWAFSNCIDCWWVSLIAIVAVIVCNIWGKGMIKIVPVLIGIVVSYAAAAIGGKVDFSTVQSAAWIGLPVKFEDTVFSLIGNCDWGMLVTAIITIVPIAFATIIEHIGDISAVSSTVGKDFIADPGLNRTLLGDGIGTTVAALFGAPANTTYSESTGVLSLTKVYDPRVIRIAAIFSIVLAFCPKFAALITAMPVATLGGISLILYGMISAIGIRNVVENHIDFSRNRNVIIAALILVLSIGVKYGTATGSLVIRLGTVSFSFSGLALAAIVGIVLNAILPHEDFEYSHEKYKSGKEDLLETK